MTEISEEVSRSRLYTVIKYIEFLYGEIFILNSSMLSSETLTNRVHLPSSLGWPGKHTTRQN